MKRILITVVLILIFINNAQSQNSKNSITRTLSYQDLVDEWVNCKDSIYTLSNAIIQYDSIKDKRFLLFKDSISSANLDTLVVRAKIKMKNISFKDYQKNSDPTVRTSLAFLKIDFMRDVSMSNCKIPSLLYFQNSKFRHKLYLNGDGNSKDEIIYFLESDFLSNVNINTSKGSLVIHDCKFEPLNKLNNQDIIWEFSSESEKSLLQFANNNFIKKDSFDYISIGIRNIYSLRFYRNEIEPNIRFAEATISDITMRDNNFQGLIDMTNVDFGYVKTELTFNQLSSHIGVYSNDRSFKGLWFPESIESFKDSIASERFFSVYRKLTEYFKSRGNSKDYNAAFTEMKNFETMQLEYYYLLNSNIESWFTWKMNLFLRVFSSYGTKPVMAIIYAFKVITIFSILFFFFHNDWDTFTKETLMVRMRLLSKYFRSKEGISDLYHAQEKSNYENYNKFLNYMQEGGDEIPKIFLWISKPLYKLSTLKLSTTTKFLRKTEILDGKWIELEGKKKAITAFWGGFILVSYLIISLIMKVLNAVMLSVNSFTTLGFGEIPTRGIGRYAAIIEGFIGWFLLTLFSVSLITQLLQ